MVAPIVIAAGIAAAAGLMQQLQAQQAQKEADERALGIQRERDAKQQYQQAQSQHLGQINKMGSGEQDALSSMIAALQRTAR